MTRGQCRNHGASWRAAFEDFPFNSRGSIERAGRVDGFQHPPQVPIRRHGASRIQSFEPAGLRFQPAPAFDMSIGERELSGGTMTTGRYISPQGWAIAPVVKRKITVFKASAGAARILGITLLFHKKQRQRWSGILHG